MDIGNETSLANGLFISVDWLSFTVKEVMTVSQVMDSFGLDPEQMQDGLTGRFGYRFRTTHCIYPISILYDGSEDMGIHVDVSGSAVGYFLQCYANRHTNKPTPFNSFAYEVESFDFTVLSDLLKDVMDIGQITRLDVAIDDKGCNYYTMDELQDIFQSNLWVSKFRKYYLSLESSKSDASGTTLYLGSRKSAIMFRMYDKKAEQLKKKKVSADSPAWVRWEIELHKDRACIFASMLIDGSSLSDLAIGILSNYLRLIQRDNVRDSRCSNSEKWDSFINGIRKIRICQPVREKTWEDKESWLKQQVSPALSAIYLRDGDLSFFYELIKLGRPRLSSELKHLLSEIDGVHCYDFE
ncbi:MAG: replication initiation factor domain-containing protein [Lachnospiraceae bacterium]|jgi:phage replication initiation protein